MKIKDKIKEIKEIKGHQVADILTFIAFIIVFVTTFLLNKYVGIYILALELLIFSYFIAKER
ncbi:hypothetical protein [Clostridium felsineum]|uniref:hypothetical protein n=1 Tax=Clostridium felsineum TaxID=36839 RepID=UPI00098C1677|nr:hypothetical protein [Clostridium felsineum]URZ15325.1 hypothetical protein CLFE_013430 [Clostridium felsineum DSM 794]